MVNAVTVADRPSKREENQLAVHEAVGKGRSRVRRNVTKATADVSKPERTKREGWVGGRCMGEENQCEGGRKPVTEGWEMGRGREGGR